MAPGCQLIQDSKALDEFLIKEKSRRSFAIPRPILGSDQTFSAGEYMAELPGDTPQGTLVWRSRTMPIPLLQTAAIPILVTQRLLKAAIEGRAAPYNFDELGVMAQHFTAQEDAANKVERQGWQIRCGRLLLEIKKSASSLMLFITRCIEKGTWARLLNIPVEGRVEQGSRGTGCR